MRPIGANARINRLRSRLDVAARENGIAASRFRDAFNRAILLLTLERAVSAGILPTYYLKGGGATELRYGFRARTTRDIDIEISGSIASIAENFKRAISIGSGDFSFAVRRDGVPIRDEAVRLEIQMLYCDRPWGRIDVDLAPAVLGDVSEGITINESWCREAGQEEAVSVRIMRSDIQIAQKIHAVTTPDPPGYELDYARHVVDVLYLASQGCDRVAIDAACHAVFEQRSSRDGRMWPPKLTSLPARWMNDYEALLKEYGLQMRPEDVERAFQQYIMSVIAGASAVPGYEYQFVLLPVTDTTRTESISNPIPPGTERDFLNELGRSGWRIQSMCPIPRESAYIIVVMERTIDDSSRLSS